MTDKATPSRHDWKRQPVAATRLRSDFCGDDRVSAIFVARDAAASIACLFMDRLDREFPQWGSNFMLPFPDDYKPPEMKEAANWGGLTE